MQMNCFVAYCLKCPLVVELIKVRRKVHFVEHEFHVQINKVFMELPNKQLIHLRIGHDEITIGCSKNRTINVVRLQ